jgi:hypothetical protein
MRRQQLPPANCHSGNTRQQQQQRPATPRRTASCEKAKGKARVSRQTREKAKGKARVSRQTREKAK